MTNSDKIKVLMKNGMTLKEACTLLGLDEKDYKMQTSSSMPIGFEKIFRDIFNSKK